MPFPFEVGFDEVQSNLDEYVDAVFGCLESEFLVMPRGTGFVEFSIFETGYEALKRATGSFQDVSPEKVAPVVFEVPISLVVLRCMLGFTPPEWAYYATQHTGVAVTQGAARIIDRKIRMKPEAALPRTGSVTERRIHALIAAACHALESGAPAASPGSLHRFEKADTRPGSPVFERRRIWAFRTRCYFTSASSVGRLQDIGTRSVNLLVVRHTRLAEFRSR